MFIEHLPWGGTMLGVFTWFLLEFSQLPVRWALWFSLCLGRNSWGRELWLAEGYTTGRRQSQDLIPGLFDAKVFALFPFIWIKFSLLSVSGSNFLSITKLYSSLNNYFKNVVLESRVYVHVCHSLNLNVLCCVVLPGLRFLPGRTLFSLYALFPATVFENQQNVVDAFIWGTHSHADFLFSHCQG